MMNQDVITRVYLCAAVRSGLEDFSIALAVMVAWLVHAAEDWLRVARPTGGRATNGHGTRLTLILVDKAPEGVPPRALFRPFFWGVVIVAALLVCGLSADAGEGAPGTGVSRLQRCGFHRTQTTRLRVCGRSAR